MKTITIKKPVSPQGNQFVDSVHDCDLPWIHNIDPSSGFVATMRVVPLDWIRGKSSREAFIEWAGDHKYAPIIERDLYAVWQAAWESCLNKVDAEMEGNEFSNASRDLIIDSCK